MPPLGRQLNDLEMVAVVSFLQSLGVTLPSMARRVFRSIVVKVARKWQRQPRRQRRQRQPRWRARVGPSWCSSGAAMPAISSMGQTVWSGRACGILGRVRTRIIFARPFATGCRGDSRVSAAGNANDVEWYRLLPESVPAGFEHHGRLSHLAAGAGKSPRIARQDTVAVKRRMPIHLKAVLVLLVAIFIYSVIVPLVSAAIPGSSIAGTSWRRLPSSCCMCRRVKRSGKSSWRRSGSCCWDAQPLPSRCVSSCLSFCPCSLAGIFPAGPLAVCNRQGAARHPSHTACIGEF